MQVINTHERELNATPDQVSVLIDSLSSEQDILWPHESWPAMKFAGALAIGASGGHGPIGYIVDYYAPGRSIKFRFKRPRGFDGYHRFEFLHCNDRSVVLRHTLNMRVKGIAALVWSLVFEPLHNALIEDSLAKAQAAIGDSPQVQEWSPYVKFLRWALSKGGAASQTVPRAKPRAAVVPARAAGEVIGIDHVYISVADMSRSEPYYDAVMTALGFRKNAFAIEGVHHVQYFNKYFGYVLRPAQTNSRHDPYAPGLHHLCLRVDSHADVVEAVKRLRSAGIETSEPKLYVEYAPDYFAAFFTDPDGIRLEITNYRQERRERYENWNS
jgi:catechol 2,3-dioxygenase-like lactoylglutathione lyase family enzyme